jgi:hypothetical protein
MILTDTEVNIWQIVSREVDSLDADLAKIVSQPSPITRGHKGRAFAALRARPDVKRANARFEADVAKYYGHKPGGVG